MLSWWLGVNEELILYCVVLLSFDVIVVLAVLCCHRSVLFCYCSTVVVNIVVSLQLFRRVITCLQSMVWFVVSATVVLFL